jgi:hypothetical protein
MSRTLVTTVSDTSPQLPQSAVHAHAELLKHTDLQFDFPALKPPEPPPWFMWLVEHVIRPLVSFLSQPFATYIVWAIVIAGALLVLFLFGKSLIRRGWFSGGMAGADAPQTEAWRPATETARSLLADADALAEAGRYAEAVHLILLRSIDDIGERRPDLLKPALTSREIGVLQALPEAARTAFAVMARIVERAIFAGRAVGAGDYQACRAEYERLAFPETWLLKRAA